MRICHVITRLIIGGAQENTVLTCAGLHDAGHAVLLLAGPDSGPEGSLWEQARSGGYDTAVIPALHREIRPLDDLRAFSQLAECYRRFAPDIIHTHSSKAGILGRWAARQCPAATVVHTIHGMSFNRTQSALRRGLYRWLECEAAGSTTHLVTVAQAMTRQAVAAGIAPPDRFTTVYSGMDTAGFAPDPRIRDAVRREWQVGPEQTVIGTVARMFRNKGYEQLLPAAAALAAAHPQVRFIWIGDGRDRPRYERRLRDLHLDQRVTLDGLQQPQDVARKMQGFDLLVHCSQWEGLPRTVVQALLLEVPAVGFDIDGAPEVLHDGRTGRRVPLNDIAALVQAVSDLVADPPQRRAMGQAGRRLCLQRFDHRAMVRQLDALYRRLHHPSSRWSTPGPPGHDQNGTTTHPK